MHESKLKEIKKIEEAKRDVLAGKEPQSNHPAYIETYSIESSLKIVRGAK